MKKLPLILLCLPMIGFGQIDHQDLMKEIYIQMFWQFIIAFIIMLLLREVFCWYWKINDIKKTVEEQRNILRNIEYSTMKSKDYLKIIADKEKSLSKSIKKDSKKIKPNLSNKNYPDDHPLKH